MIKLFLNIKILILFSALSVSAQSVWKESSFNDFKDGRFLDAGSNAYVSAKGRIQMITRWDFNNDGHLDLYIPGGHGSNEKENIYVYLNNGLDIDGRSRIELPGGGSRDGLILDFNKDGLNDLAVVNYADSHYPKVPAWIYYGTKKGFTPSQRVELPAAFGTSLAAGDFNNDSWIDLAVGCQFFEGDDENSPKKSFIYWNSPEGFSPDRNLEISFNNLGAKSLAGCDLDNDGITDLIFMTGEKTYLLLSSKKAFDNPLNSVLLDIRGLSASSGDINNDNLIDLAFCTAKGIIIFYGNKNFNYNPADSFLLSADNPSDVVIKDVNNDGLDDIIVSRSTNSGGASWTDSYVIYSDGNNFSSNKRTALPTMGAAGVSCGDLNNDGFPEIVFSNQRILNQMNLASYVYWNDKGSFRFENHTQLATQGPHGNTIGDVNNDGLPDVVFFNYEGYFLDGPILSHIYWGDGSRNYSEQNRTEFHTHQIFGFGHADLDDDGFVDLVIARQKFYNSIDHEQSGILIEWNNKGSFNTPTQLTMERGYGGVRLADINRDGYLDILGSGICVDLGNPDKNGFPIFWGSSLGYSIKNRTVLHALGQRMRGPLLMDLNKDNWLDIVGQVEDGKIRFWWGDQNGFSNERYQDLALGRKDHLMYIKGADINNDGWLDLFLPNRGAPDGRLSSSLILYGSENGFDINNKDEIATYVPYQNTFADINKDGWLDLFVTSYGGEVRGNRPSLLYYGSKNGYKTKPVEIESYGSSGSEILDFDGDGWLDILITNHRKSGSYSEAQPHRHICPTLLYWGGPNGFSGENRKEFIAVGPSGLNLRDAGNSYDRKLYEDYCSSVYRIPDYQIPSVLKWEADTPYGSSVQFQIRTSEDESLIENSEWIGPEGNNSWFTENGSAIKYLSGKYIQYRARLISPNGAATPYLNAVEIYFSKK
ncbi:MAG TPA: VCBS repeat-containing protein [Melioribacteraceae bacterium]|nr:VCBS repeat-containing protein [Melioribacteraceae bacterium]